MAAAMSQLSQEDAKLASQCLEICQTLAGKSLPFAFCINIGSNFSFSVDTRGKEVEVLANSKRKKKTPSTLRRDARRREDFLNKKLNAPTAEKTFKCDQCDGTFKSENGLKIHIGKAHKTPQPKESLRHSGEGSASLSASLTLDTTREEKEFSFSSTPGKEKEDPATSPQPLPPPTRPTVAQMQESLALYRALHSKPVATK